MVRIRLRREGKKGQPSYRIVAADKESPRDGRFLEILGHYNPRTEPATIVVKEDRVYDWISKGAQPSDSVWQVLRQIGADERIKRFKAGEDVETLLAEAEAGLQDVDPRTKVVAAPKAAKAEAAAAAAEVDEAPEVAETSEEPEAVEEVEADSEEETESEEDTDAADESEASDEEEAPAEEE